MSELIKIRDINNVWRVFDVTAIYEAFITGNLSIVGLTAENMMDLKTEYDRRVGPYPVPTNSIRKTFKIKGE